MWTADHWRDIVSRATPMFDRLLPAWQTQPLSGDELNTRMAAWQHSAAAGDATLFARRLAWDGLDHAQVRCVLSPGVTAAALPPWVAVLDSVVADLTPAPAEEDPWPFEEIVGAIAGAARRRVQDRLPARVLDGFERALFRRLHWFCLRTLELEFDVVRPRTGLAGLLEDSGRQRYDAFVAGVLGDRFQTVFTRYPVLARLVGTTLVHWVAWVEEFAKRLAAEGLPLAVGVEAAISDRHDGGRAAVMVRFADASVRVYKPRNPSIDVAWTRVVEWFNECGPLLPLRCPRVLDRGDYAWVEWVPHRECASRDELARFYRRAGSLMCLFFVLEGNDAHLENLVASGEHPVLVDVETLLHPLLQSGVRPIAVRQAMSDSVMRTGMVGAQVRGAAGRAADFGGLVAGGEQEGIVRRPHWRGVGTDGMEIYLDLGVQHGRAHLPGPDVRAGEFVDELEAGFVNAWHIIATHRDTLPLDALAESPVRFLLRNTLEHFVTMREAAHPRALSDGVLHSIGLERLARFYLREDARPPYWPLLAAEIEALQRLDIPRFTTSPSSADVSAGGLVAKDCVIPGAEIVRRRLADMSDHALRRQLVLLRACLNPPAGDIAPTVPPPITAPLDTDILGTAYAVFERLRASAVGDDASMTWIAPRPTSAGRDAHIDLLPLDLYAGSAGAAVFLSALARVTGDAAVRRFAQSALEPVVRGATASLLAAVSEGIGGVSGAASCAYALTCAASLLDAPDYLEHALRWARLVTERRLASDTRLDVMDGVAGSILAMLALHQVRPSPWLLDRACAGGRHLIACRDRWPDGGGFGHGLAGIVHACHRLAELSGDDSFRVAVDPVSDVTSAAWCRGAAGSALQWRSRPDTWPSSHDDSLCCGTAGVADVLLALGRRADDGDLVNSGMQLIRHLAARGPGDWRLPGTAELPRPSLFAGWAGVGYVLLRALDATLPCMLTLQAPVSSTSSAAP